MPALTCYDCGETIPEGEPAYVKRLPSTRLVPACSGCTSILEKKTRSCESCGRTLFVPRDRRCWVTHYDIENKYTLEEQIELQKQEDPPPDDELFDYTVKQRVEAVWTCPTPECKRERKYRAAREKRREERTDLKCQECGDTFTPDRSDAKYCSAACKQRAYRKRKKSEA